MSERHCRCVLQGRNPPPQSMSSSSRISQDNRVGQPKHPLPLPALIRAQHRRVGIARRRDFDAIFADARGEGLVLHLLPYLPQFSHQARARLRGPKALDGI